VLGGLAAVAAGPASVGTDGLQSLLREHYVKLGKTYHSDCHGFTRIAAHKVLHSNLGNKGPDSGEEGIILSAVEIDEDKGDAPDVRHHLVMKINALTPYEPFDKTDNGLDGKFLTISEHAGHELKVSISFWEGNHTASKPWSVPHKLGLSVYDLDTSANNTGVEYFIVSDFADEQLTKSTKVKQIDDLGAKVKKLDLGAGAVKFEATVYGNSSDNPVDPSDLTQDQKDKAAVVEYKPNTHSINVTFGSTVGPIPRRFMFFFEDALLCEEKEVEALKVTQAAAPKDSICVNDFTRIRLLETAHSNLGGMGPDKGEEGILYKAVEINEERTGFVNQDIIVKISALSPYHRKDEPANGLEGSFAYIALDSGDSIDVAITFEDAKTRKDIKLEKKLGLSFYDLDHGAHHKGVEYFVAQDVSDDDSVFMTSDSTVLVHDVGGHHRFEATEYGDGEDNPEDPSDLTADQRDKAVVVVYPPGEQSIKLTLGSIGFGAGVRYAMFVFESNLLCAEEGLWINDKEDTLESFEHKVSAKYSMLRGGPATSFGASVGAPLAITAVTGLLVVFSARWFAKFRRHGLVGYSSELETRVLEAEHQLE